MSRIHKTYPFLLSHESPADDPFDLVYRPEPADVWAAGTLLVDYDLTRLSRMGASNWKCAELEDIAGPYRRVLIQVAQFDSLQQVKRDMYAASRMLSLTGELRVAIPPKSGAKRIKSDAQQVFAKVETVKTAGLTLLICREPTPQPFPDEPSYIEYQDPSAGRRLKFMVRPGVFSAERIDMGTQLLLETAQTVGGETVLDVGCGYGAIGVTAAGRGAEVTLLDIDARALKLAAGNLSLNALAGNVLLKLQPYEFADNAFDVVLSNPPTHAGSETLRVLFGEMVRVSRDRVALVVREHLNYEKWLNELGTVRRLTTAHGYKILQINKG
jgi:16S rRNA G1207 methylase RsmC